MFEPLPPREIIRIEDFLAVYNDRATRLEAMLALAGEF